MDRFKNDKQQQSYHQYLEGGGEMGRLTRAFDWSTTVIGSPDQWSLNLLNTISLMFNSKYPMFIWWGPELIQFYNDAYRPLMGTEGKHPKALGQTGAECWPEIWPVIKPLIDEVFKGEAIWNEDQLIPIYRDGKLDDVYWTFGYNGIKDETGKIAGVLVICNETTEKIKTKQKINNIVDELLIARNELEFTIEAAELATWDYNPLTNKITGNTRFKKWFGLPLNSNDAFDLDTVNQVIVEEDKDRVKEAICKALQKGANGNYSMINTIIDPENHTRRVLKIRGKAICNGKLSRFMGTMQDVTEEYQVFAKLDDGLLSADLNLTERKQVGLEKFKNFTILHQSEKIAKMGSWEYDLFIRKLTWSDGMYTLFNMPLGTTVHSNVYQQYASVKDKSIAERITNCLENAIPFEETIEVLVKGLVKTIKIKATVIADADDKLLKIIGADIDITEQIKLQKEKEQLERQQSEMETIQKQKIFWATMNAQEAERKRIAESLHNGLGQLLYGVKLSLDHLNINKKLVDSKWLENKRTTDLLLAQSINECREISHELSPAVLDDFGLQEAIKTICQQFRPSLLISCKFVNYKQQLDKNIEIAIYRTVQELLFNSVKHSQASKSSVKIEMSKRNVIITVQDNGIGFNTNNKSNGIGLITIRNKVKLLNGEFRLSSQNGKGSTIRISIPYEIEKGPE